MCATVVFGVVASSARAQYFKPFHANSKKLFALSSIPTPGFSLAFDSATVEGGDSIFHHFGALNDTSTFIHPDCSGWGSPYCYRAELPLWSGSLFRTDNAGNYRFRTLDGDTLHFNFNAALGDTQVFLEDPVQRFSYVKSGPDTMTALGYIDSVFTYTILHTDPDNLPIASALDHQPIIIGKDLGLIRFFQVDSFPEVLTPLVLVGNKGPDLGLHRITSATLHDHQPGDIVQYKTYTGNTLPNGQPFNFTKNTILSRSDTPDSVIYDVAWEYFNINWNYINTGTTTIKYSKNDVLAELPFERFDGALVSLISSATPSCPLPIWRLYREVLTGLGPCGSGGCWVATDTQGPPPDSYNGILLGVGTWSYFYQEPVDLWHPHYFDIAQIVYYKKNGVVCGAEAHVGLEEFERTQMLTIAPNPTSGIVVVSAQQLISTVQVSDSYGRIISLQEPNASHLEVDLSALPTGAYCARILLHDGSNCHRTVITVR